MSRRITYMPVAAMDALRRHSWPGNIRELQNLIERAVILSPGEMLRVPLSEIEHDLLATRCDSGGTLEEAERTHILSILKETRWVLSGPRAAATRLGINRSRPSARTRRRRLPTADDETRIRRAASGVRPRDRLPSTCWRSGWRSPRGHSPGSCRAERPAPSDPRARRPAPSCRESVSPSCSARCRARCRPPRR
jgi:hypothetical protein